MRFQRRFLLRSIAMTALAIAVMGVILFPVYYIFIVSLEPGSTLATTHIQLTPRHPNFNSYEQVLFGLSGSTINENFTGTVEGTAALKDGMLYIEHGVLRGVVKYGPFTGFTFSVPVSGVSFKLTGGGVQQTTTPQTFSGKVHGLVVLTSVSRNGTVGFGLIRNLVLTGGKVKSVTVSGPLAQRFILMKGAGTVVHFTTLGKFVNSTFFHYLVNSLILAGLAVLLTWLFAVPAAYAFSRMKFSGRGYILYFYLMFTQVAGGLGIAGLIALYGIVVKIGLYNKLPVLSLIYAAGGVPFNTWLLKSYIDSISPDFDEAAIIDGASYLQIIRYVLLPLALPGIATVSIFAFIGGWTEFILANLLLEQSNQPLAVWIWSLLSGINRGIQWSYFAAAALLFALPVFILFMLAQNYIRSGLTLGGLKE